MFNACHIQQIKRKLDAEQYAMQNDEIYKEIYTYLQPIPYDISSSSPKDDLIRLSLHKSRHNSRNIIQANNIEGNIPSYFPLVWKQSDNPKGPLVSPSNINNVAPSNNVSTNNNTNSLKEVQENRFAIPKSPLSYHSKSRSWYSAGLIIEPYNSMNNTTNSAFLSKNSKVDQLSPKKSILDFENAKSTEKFINQVKHEWTKHGHNSQLDTRTVMPHSLIANNSSDNLKKQQGLPLLGQISQKEPRLSPSRETVIASLQKGKILLSKVNTSHGLKKEILIPSTISPTASIKTYPTRDFQDSCYTACPGSATGISGARGANGTDAGGVDEHQHRRASKIRARLRKSQKIISFNLFRPRTINNLHSNMRGLFPMDKKAKENRLNNAKFFLKELSIIINGSNHNQEDLMRP